MAYMNFDASTVPTDSIRDALPAGDYPMVITDSAVKTARSGGTYLELTLQVIEGPYLNRLVWDRITLDNPNTQAVEIGRRQLSQACHAIGVLQLQDSSQLHGTPLVARLKYKEDPQYGPKNEVSGYRPMGEKPASAPPPPVEPAKPWKQAPAAPAASSTPPWAARA
jgi:hypothetical protein